jgi:hypothetical protein
MFLLGQFKRTVHFFDLPQPPYHPEKTLPEAGMASKTTLVLLGKRPVQDPFSQERPGGSLCTLPSPLMLMASRIKRGVEKTARTFLCLFKRTAHFPDPPQTPRHPEKTLPEAGMASKTTLVPLGNFPEQDLPLHIRPFGELRIFPPPFTNTRSHWVDWFLAFFATDTDLAFPPESEWANAEGVVPINKRQARLNTIPTWTKHFEGIFPPKSRFLIMGCLLLIICLPVLSDSLTVIFE